MLIDAGFNKTKKDGTTRLGFDMVVSSKNVYEVGKTLQYCRDNNMWIMFAFYLPAGRVLYRDHDADKQMGEDVQASQP